MNYKRPQPGRQSPRFEVQTLGGGSYDLHKRDGEDAAMIVFYRGFHCPKCKEQLKEFDRNIAEFNKRGISIIAVSMDNEERARKAHDAWEISQGIRFGYGLTEEDAREWGLFLSKAEFDSEPEIFCEPGLYLIDADNDIFAGWIQSIPFARPVCSDILSAIDFIRDKSYPARGKAA